MALSFQATALAGDDDENSADAPNRGVARISIINGNVSVRRGDSGEAVAAALNAPMTATDRLTTGEGSRAEIQFDGLNMIRLAPQTEVRLGEMEYHKYQIQIATGTTTFRVLRDNQSDVEISTPSIAVRPLKKGVYRISVQPDGTSEVTVRQGEAEIFSPKGSEKLGTGRTMMARGTAGDPEFQIVGAISLDQWDKWNADRDRDLERVGSARYVNPDINGTEELDANGRWVNDPSYGEVWVPTVQADWAPYRVGRWVWVDYYGWTWVSDDPWGWAPYHYGRWYWGSYGWAWWPGVISGPCYWRPALVGFFGWGGGVGFGVGFGFGHVGWVPLAPYERFHPWYGRGYYGRGFNSVNIVNNTNITNIYRNARVTNGVTGMPADRFGRGGVNTSNFSRATSGDLARAGAVRGAMPLTPTRESTHFSDRSASSAGMPRVNDGARFFSRTNTSASAPNRVSFDQQRQAMSNSVSNVNNHPAFGGNTTSATNTGAGGWQRSGNASPNVSSPNVSSPHSSNNNVNPSNNSGWQRFNPSTHSNSNAPLNNASPNTGHSSAPTVNSAPSNSGAGGWQRFNGHSSGPINGGSNAPANGSSRTPQSYSAPAQSAPSHSSNAQPYNATPRNYSSGSSQPVHINPPIVQNRGGSAPPSGGSNHSVQSHGGFGGAHSGGGGGGGGSHPSGGGGGGSHGGGRK